MSLDKAIKSGKEHRKPYRGGKARSCSCRNHGSCSWCQGNRQHADVKRQQANELSLQEAHDSAERESACPNPDVCGCKGRLGNQPPQPLLDHLPEGSH